MGESLIEAFKILKYSVEERIEQEKKYANKF